MSKYIVKPVVCDYGIFIVDDDGNEELVEVCNSQVNANTICEIFNADLMKDGQYAIWKDDKIADLELKLAEKEKEIERFRLMKNREQLVKENEVLKDTIAVVLSQKSNWAKRCKELKQQVAEKDAEIEGRKNLCYLRYKQLQDAHKDKIEFAIAELEKVKDTIDKSGHKILEALWVNFVVIDKQIEQLNASNSMPLKEEDKQ